MRHTPRVIASVLLAGLLACSSDDPTSETAPPGTTDGGTTEAGTTDGGTTNGGDTGTTGDPNVPAPTYEVSLQGWSLQPGEETTRCSVVEVGNSEAAFIGAIETTLAPGSHHLIIYTSDEEVSEAPFNCEPFTDTLSNQPLMISEIGSERLELPDGVALSLAAGQRVLIEAHYLNYFPDTIEAGATVRFETRSADEVEHEAAIALLGTSSFAVGPGAEFTTQWTWFDMPNGSHIYALTGHTHQWGTNVEVETSTGRFDEGTPVYPPADAPFVWNEAPVAQFSPPLEFESGLGLRMRCSWRNEGDEIASFGLSANEEMCFIWAYYYPATDYTLCLNGLLQECLDDNGDGGAPSTGGQRLATVRVRDLADQPVVGATVTVGDQEETTDPTGIASFPVTGGMPYEVRIAGDGLLPTQHYGVAPESDFVITTFLVSSERVDEIAAEASTTADPTRGTLAVAMFHNNGTAASGGQVLPGLDYEVATVDEDGAQVEGDTIPAKTDSFWVTFVNVAPGDTEVRVNPPAGSACRPFEAGVLGEGLTVNVAPATTTLALFMCEPAS